jgi:calcineurin-like phosphoesterase family protein
MQYHARHAHRRILYDDMEHHPSYKKIPSKVVEVLNGRVCLVNGDHWRCGCELVRLMLA